MLSPLLTPWALVSTGGGCMECGCQRVRCVMSAHHVDRSLRGQFTEIQPYLETSFGDALRMIPVQYDRCPCRKRRQTERGHPERWDPERWEVGSYKARGPSGAPATRASGQGGASGSADPWSQDPVPGLRGSTSRLSATNSVGSSHSSSGSWDTSRSQYRMQRMAAPVIEIITQLCRQGDRE